jgi:hypothetical protein
VGNPKAWNRYAYVYGNPLRYTDPSGHCAEFGDESCWSKYEQLKRVCPECTHYRSAGGIDIPLAKLNESQLDNLVLGLAGEYRPMTQPGELDSLKSVLPDGTHSIPVGLTIDFPIEVVFGGHILHVDDDLNFAVGTGFIGFGAASAVGITVGVGGTGTNASNIGELRGWVVTGGIGGTAGVFGGGIDGLVGPEGDKGRIFGGSIYGFAGPKAGIPLPPGFIHANTNYTTETALITGQITENGIEDFCVVDWCSLSAFSD